MDNPKYDGIPTKEELDRKHEEECPNWKLLQNLVMIASMATDDSLHAIVLSIIAIVLSAVSIILRFV